MKQVKVKFPVRRVDELSTALYEIGFITVVSWKDEQMIEADTITVVGVIPEDKAEEFKTKLGQYIIK